MGSVNFSAIFSVQDKVSGTLDKINKSGSGLTQTFGGLAKAAAGVFTATKAIQFGKESVNAFATFENGMNEVFTLMPDLSSDAMDQMTQQIKDFSKEQGVLTTESVPALYQAISAGVPKENVFDFLETANKAAVGGVATLEDSVGVLSTVVNNYGSDIIDVDQASDLLFNTVRKGVTSFPELAVAIGDVLPSAASANVSFEQVAASLATLTATMGKGSTPKAVTALRSLFDELSNSSTNTSKTFQRLSGQTFAEFMQAGGSIADVMEIMQTGADEAGVAIADLFSSVESKKAVNIFSENNNVLIGNLMEMSNAAGATEAAFEKMEEGFKRKLDRINAHIEILKINVGGKLADAFNYLWDKAEPVVSAMSQGFEYVRELFSKLGFVGAVENLFGEDAGKFAKDLEKLASFVQPVIDTIKNAFTSMMPTIRNVMDFFSQTFFPIFQNIFHFIVYNAVRPFVAYFQENVPKLANIFNNVWSIMQPIFNHFAQAFSMVWDVASPIIGSIIQAMANLGSSIFTILDGIIQFLAGAFSGDWQAAWEGIVNIFGGIWDGMVTLFKTPMNWIIDGINSFLQSLNTIKIPDWVPEVGGKGFNIQEIPKLAVGSLDAPNTSIAGKSGSKLITGAQGSGVFPSDETSQILSALNRANQPIHVSSDPYENYGNEYSEKTININININGQGEISAQGVSKEDILDVLIVHLKPILMKIIKAEIYEEGDLSYEF